MSISSLPASEADAGPVTTDRLLDQMVAHQLAELEAVPSGFQPLDLVLEGGFRPEELVIVGGKPGAGKTIAMLQWARSAARMARPVAFVCYEHTERSLLRRLITAEVAELAAGTVDRSTLTSLRRLIRDYVEGRLPYERVAAAHPLVGQALDNLRADGPFLLLIRGSGLETDLDALDRLAQEVGEGGMLMVDYLQKVPDIDRSAGGLRSGAVHVTTRLKDISLERGIVVVAASASDDAGLESRRLRMNGLRGSSGLAHEADVALLLNEKAEVVSRKHTAYDPTLLETFGQRIVLTIEKFRDGPAPEHLEFMKDFGNFRFEPAGGFVSERIVGDGLYDE